MTSEEPPGTRPHDRDGDADATDKAPNETGENDPTSRTGSSDSDQLLQAPSPPLSSAANSSRHPKLFEKGASKINREGYPKSKASDRPASWLGVRSGASHSHRASTDPGPLTREGKGLRSGRLAPFSAAADSGGGRVENPTPEGPLTSKVTRSETSAIQPGAVRVLGVNRQDGDESSSKFDDDPSTLAQTAGRGNQATTVTPLDDIESGAFTASTSSTTAAGGDIRAAPRDSMMTAVTATAVSDDDLEQEVRDRLRREAVVALVASDDAPESARDEGVKAKPPFRSCRFAALIFIVASTIVGVTLIAVLTTAGPRTGGEVSNTTSSPPRVWTPEELKDFIVGELGTARGFELDGFTPAKASYDLILAGGTFNNVTLGTRLMDAFAIMALWAGTGGSKGWTRSDGWNQNPYPCTWYGIGCNEKGRVAKISVPGNGLSGPLNPDLRYLAGQLTHLDVSGNKVGLFKFNLTSLRNLQHFNFSKNANGEFTIEDVTHYNLTRLEVLDLSSCVLGGPISPEIARLPKLRQLHLQDNLFTGPIPDEVGTLKLLTSLRLEDNLFSGSIPVDACSRNASVSVDCTDVTCTCCFCDESS
jgi:hypothetical protein